MSETGPAAMRPFEAVRRRLGASWPRIVAASVAGPAVALVLAQVSEPLGFVAGAVAAFGASTLVARFREGRGGLAPALAAADRSATAQPAHSLLEALPEPVILVDAAQQVVHANLAATRVFGAVAVGEALALRFRAPEFLAVIEAAIQAAEPTKASLMEGRAARRVWAVDIAPVPAAAGRSGPLFLLLFRDRTAERGIERMRTDFVANASHELRTPLASLIGFIETLQGPARDDAAARDRFLAIMREQAARMSRLIDDLLSLSQIEMKRHPVPGRSVDLAELLEDVRRAMSPMLAANEMEAELEIGPGRHVVDGERDELLQVFSNLVENACKYGASGRRVVLSLRVEGREGGGVRASVRDFGPGIAAEHVPRLTERFYRVDVESSRAKRGTGLGLSIVRNILLRHSARLAIDSEVGKGSTFAVIFPRPKHAAQETN
ncbi:ATP-binding protein [Aureimonas leprariae]|uniref:histidine kinase n=1 Tax=Plantimonas leprariae TaxID=2615207 RepID=A0A7V7PMX7_9HYPH|nr:ATP-binding protein [Aureimonas leprariae]KAB0678738.1 PAS domain-containing protein [Aureimonas leprariae]